MHAPAEPACASAHIDAPREVTRLIVLDDVSLVKRSLLCAGLRSTKLSLNLDLVQTSDTARHFLVFDAYDETFSRVDGEGEPELPDTDQTRFGTRS